jgi:hypothetical protein
MNTSNHDSTNCHQDQCSQQQQEQQQQQDQEQHHPDHSRHCQSYQHEDPSKPSTSPTGTTVDFKPTNEYVLVRLCRLLKNICVKIYSNYSLASLVIVSH